MAFSNIFLVLFIMVLMFGTLFALDFVLPGSFDGKSLKLYPGINTTIGFLKVESGTQVFVDTINCEGVTCSTIKTSGPYYVFDVSGTNKTGKITVNYHLKGSEENLKNIFDVVNTEDNLFVLVFLPTDAKFFEKTEARILVVNNSDLKLSGKIYSNFPDSVFVSTEFNLEPKTKKEWATYFFPKNPGAYDLIYYVSVNGTESKRKIGQHTVNILKELKDFLSLPTKSFFPTNPIMTLYSATIYFVSLFA